MNDEPDPLDDWLEFGARLRAVNPHRFEQIRRQIRDMVESQELLASVPAPLRPFRRFRIRRYVA